MGRVPLLVRDVLFTLVVPGTGGVLVPWWLLGLGAVPPVRGWYGGVVIGAGVALYVASVRAFAVAGRGTPGPWDPPRRVVDRGPYRYVRNPIYVAAMLIVLGEAGLFGSVTLLEYAGGAAVAFHLLVVWYEEPRLRRAFGEPYAAYVRTVRRWIPLPRARRMSG